MTKKRSYDLDQDCIFQLANIHLRKKVGTLAELGLPANYSGEFSVVKLKETRRYRNGKLHHSVLPAVVMHGTQSTSEWFYHNGSMRSSRLRKGPTRVVRYAGYIEETWMHEGALHREDGPAFVEQTVSGTIIGTAWVLEGSFYQFQEWAKRTTLDEESLVLLALQYGGT